MQTTPSLHLSLVVLLLALFPTVGDCQQRPESGFGSDVSAAIEALGSLAKRYAAQELVYREAIEAAGSNDEREKAYLEVSPQSVFVDDLLAIEQQHRGSAAAISALFRLIENARTTVSLEAPCAHGRREAIARARKHYLSHSDLDLLLTCFDSGVYVPEAQDLLRAATDSPHTHVRVAGKYYLARFLYYLASQHDRAASFMREESEGSHSAAFLRQFLELGPRGEEIAREEAVRLASEIRSEDFDVPRFYPKTERPGGLLVRRETYTGASESFASAAEALHFELTKLQVGQAAPEIVGKDADGVEFELSDYRGHVVLFMFSAGWCGPCKALYPDIRKLQREMADRPFTVLAAMADRQLSDVIREIKTGDIQWRVWFDGPERPIARRWNVQRWPTIYVIDEDGIIVDRQPGQSYAGLKNAVLDAFDGAEDASSHPGEKFIAPRDRAELDFQFDIGVARPSSLAAGSKGRLLAVGGWHSASHEEWKNSRVKGAVELWDLVERQAVKQLSVEQGAVSAVALSPDGGLLATAGRAFGAPRRGHLTIWDVNTGKMAWALGDQPAWLLATAFSPDGAILAAAGFDRTPRVYRVSDGKEIATLPRQSGSIDNLLFTPDGTQLIVPNRSGVVTMWNTRTWEQEAQLEAPRLFLLAAALSPDGRLLAVGGKERPDDGGIQTDGTKAGRVMLWTLPKSENVANFETNAGVSGLSFSSDNNFLAATGLMTDMVVWRLPDPKVHALIQGSGRGIGSSGNRITFLPGSKRFVSLIPTSEHEVREPLRVLTLVNASNR